ncbi:c-type cytochrome [Pedosphaera parvula]|uniref:Putative cytochrome c n=1 Tax=Pedosphaera parvula (strain Ellin514) TaxID=320771 RepID=B9XI31_PEDPL|nr:c-type cytochrome [Pedosphaera parvula]EEF60524.1 putative cytochrome c [Pedosphaera parvula Ellin514]
MMRNRREFLIGFVCGLAAVFLIGLVLIVTGAFDFSASSKPGVIENKLAPYAFERSMVRRAPKQNNPFTNEPSALAVGMAHYKENCIICHGAPGSEPVELAMGLNPSAPSLQEPDIQQISDGQMFWIIKNGVRWSGMPAFGMTHNDTEIWKIVSFVRHLPQLTPEEKGNLNREPEHDHHQGGSGAHPESSP